jgi:hypothetical protein
MSGIKWTTATSIWGGASTAGIYNGSTTITTTPGDTYYVSGNILGNYLNPTPKEPPVRFNAKKYLVMKAEGGLVGVYDTLDDAQEAAEQHAESCGERAFICKAVKVAKPTRRDVKTEDV